MQFDDILLANSSVNNPYLFLQKYFWDKVWEEFISLEDFIMLQNAPCSRNFVNIMWVNKINTLVVLFYLYPGKELLPDSEKIVKKLKNRMLHALLLYWKRKKKTLLVEFMMLW